MQIAEIAVTSHAAASLLFVVLAGFFVRPWREKLYSGFFIIASLVTAYWQMSMAPGAGSQTGVHFQVFSSLHMSLWILALLRTLVLNMSDAQNTWKELRPLYLALLALAVLGAVVVPYLMLGAIVSQAGDLSIWVNLLLGLLGIITAEQVFRNTLDQQKQAITFLCIGASLFFAFDVLVYSNALLFSKLDQNFAELRPIVNLAAAICLVFATTRTQQSSRVSISRSVVFYSASLVVAGVFLLIMAAVAYYVTLFGGDWSAILRATLLGVAILVLGVVFASPRWRASLRVFINKNFFMHKYDYRTEWLNLINILSQPSQEKDEKTIAMEAACAVFHADHARLWLKVDNQYQLVASTHDSEENLPSIAADSDICEILASEWVFHPSSKTRFNANNNLALPEWTDSIQNLWIIAPLIAQQRLLGFIMLDKQDYKIPLTWEDLDVLRTVGRQLGSYLALNSAAEQLAQSKQFDTYNKLTAFIMHDLKNLIAQQALVVENAKKHKENPAFVEDAIRTIENSVERMSKLLGKMQQRGPSKVRSLELQKILLESVNKCRDKKPAPSLRLNDEPLWVAGDRDHLVMILAHVIKNAQEATPTNGFVDVFTSRDREFAIITVEDNGQGMSDKFIKNRLFQPFDTTKSGQGMGIGVYQTREYIRNLGGDVQVESAEGIGTTFTISMPIVQEMSQNVG